jgi:hypothetical protein
MSAFCLPVCRHDHQRGKVVTPSTKTLSPRSRRDLSVESIRTDTVSLGIGFRWYSTVDSRGMIRSRLPSVPPPSLISMHKRSMDNLNNKNHQHHHEPQLAELITV